MFLRVSLPDWRIIQGLLAKVLEDKWTVAFLGAIFFLGVTIGALLLAGGHIVVGEGSSSDFSRPSEFMVNVFSKQAEERSQRLEMIKSAEDDHGFASLYNELVPEVFCAEKMQVGLAGNGGKWMCSPQRLPDDCTIFVLGISRSLTFEKDIQSYSEQKCKIIAVDSDDQDSEVINSLEEIGGAVIQAEIGAETNTHQQTMQSILEAEGADSVEVMKIDVEGAELSTMDDFLDTYQPAQIMIEVHGTPLETVEFLQMVASKGYYLFHYEINGKHHSLAEYDFIHEDKLDQYQATLIASYLRS